MAHEKVKVKLIGEDGNAFAILGRVSKALKRSGQPEAAAEYRERAMAGDYDHLLRVTLEYAEEPQEFECGTCGEEFTWEENESQRCPECGDWAREV